MSMEDIYTGYYEFKCWPQRLTSEATAFYDDLASRVGISVPAHVLEIGFGGGTFLQWCKMRGIAVTGVETLKEALEQARSAGFDVIQGPLETGRLSHRYDAVFAFDVFEHLARNDIIQLLRLLHGNLDAGGKVVLRFPNGTSPFYDFHQNSDLTHRMIISETVIDQFCRISHYQKRQVTRDRRPVEFCSRLRRNLSYFVRNLIEIVVGYAYQGAERILSQTSSS